jgi:peptidoglycan/LPS O-acetylase OafA/YrhL
VFFANGLVTAACGAIVFVASFGKDYITPKPLPVRRVVLWIGSRSFALYLCHILLFQLTRELWFRLSPMGTQFDSTFTLRYAITGIALICAASELNYRLVERPMRNRGRRIADDFLSRRHTHSTPAT